VRPTAFYLLRASKARANLNPSCLEFWQLSACGGDLIGDQRGEKHSAGTPRADPDRFRPVDSRASAPNQRHASWPHGAAGKHQQWPSAGVWTGVSALSSSRGCS